MPTGPSIIRKSVSAISAPMILLDHSACSCLEHFFLPPRDERTPRICPSLPLPLPFWAHIAAHH
jgi:hypothetical protein